MIEEDSSSINVWPLHKLAQKVYLYIHLHNIVNTCTQMGYKNN